MSSSPQQYTIIEPHPTVKPSQQYLSTGRGGAGNLVKPPVNVTRGSDASGPASRSSTSSSNPRRSFLTGRGGAGNYINDAPRMFSFDEELEHQMKQSRNVAPVYHVGRGGAGNLHRASNTSSDAQHLLTRRASSNSNVSSSSAESGADIATRNFKKGLKKIAGVF